MANDDRTLKQCLNCGQLKNGVVKIFPCRDPKGHDFQPLSRETIARSLGSAGGRPKVYKTDEERIAARKKVVANSNRKRRNKGDAVAM